MEKKKKKKKSGGNMNRKIVYENVEPQMKVLTISELVFRGV